MERRKRRRDSNCSINQIKVVETFGRLSGAANDGGAVGELDTSGVKVISETIVTKLPGGY